MIDDQLTERSFDTRVAAWSQWGAVDDDVLTHLINPMLMGGPSWPGTRQAYVVARRSGALLLASDGLSDPYDSDPDDDDSVEPDVNGLGHEFYAITTDPIDTVAGSWLWDMVWQMSNNAANHGGVADLIDELTLLSVSLYGVDIPAPQATRFVDEQDGVGVLLGVVDKVPPATVTGPLSPIRLINIKLLTLDELAYAMEHGTEGRRELARRFTAKGDPLISSLERPSVV